MFKESLKGDPSCTVCKGEGYVLEYIESDLYETKLPAWRHCRCLKQKKEQNRLKDLFNSKEVDNSPLLEELKSNLFIRGNSESFKSHLKFTFSRVSKSFDHCLLRDTEILETTFNVKDEGRTLSDFIKHDLVIIFMGYSGFKSHNALPGLILEVIKNRMFSGKPTWIYTNRIFDSSVPEWNQELDDTLSDFKQVKISSDNKLSSTEKIKKIEGKKLGPKNVNDMIKGI